MPAPSPLTIATQSVTRLVKEESYYRKELESQKKKVEEARKERPAEGAETDYNETYLLRQQETAIRETEKVLGPLRTKIDDAVAKLEEQIALSESSGGASDEDLMKARDALSTGGGLKKEEPKAEEGK